MLALLSVLALASGAMASVSGPLDILLTNDDGWDSVGIQTLKTALEAQGHAVTLVAPAHNRSGSSASLTLDWVEVVQMSGNEYAVDGTPATCVLLGISGILDERPHLVVSGTNDGKNYGPAAPFSGTVGATIAAIRAGLPGIALSTEPPVDDETNPAYTQHFQNVATFAVELIDRMQTYNPEPGVLPRGMALNVNYPPLAPEQVQGVTIAVQGRYSSGLLAYEEVVPGWFAPFNGPPVPGQVEVAWSDRTAFHSGYVTVVPINGDYTAGSDALVLMFYLLYGLEP
jgi:5'/3'-nucleotidase SurE